VDDAAQIFLKLRENLSSKISILLDKCLLNAANKLGQVLIVREINPCSLAQMCWGATTKSYDISYKTQSSGLLAGFILPPKDDNTLNKPIVIDVGNKKYAVINFQNPKLRLFSEDDIALDDAVYALVDEDNRYITSDLDLFMVLSKDYPGESFFDKNLGYINNIELETINFINNMFLSLLNGSDLNKRYSKMSLVTHGSANLFPGSKKEHVKFPLMIYFPTHEKTTIKNLEDFTVLLNNLKSNSYKLSVNPNWETCF
jgi:hypothetical protein